MRKQIIRSLLLNLAVLLVAGTSLVQAQNRPYKVRDSQVQYILNRIESRTDTYKREMNTALDKSPLNNTKSEDLVMDYITNFENATDLLKQKFDVKESVVADVQDVLTRAAYIDRFMKNNSLTTRAQTYWRYLVSDLNTLSRYYGVTSDWRSAPATINTPYRVSDDQVETTLKSIELKTDQFKRSLDRALDRSRINGTTTEDSVNQYVGEFETATDNLKRKFEMKKSVAEDVQEILNKAYYIDNFMKNNRLRMRAENDWTGLKSDLDVLAGYYNVSWNWTTPPVGDTAGNDRVFNVPPRTIQALINSIESKTDVYKREMNTALDKSFLNNSKSEDAIFAYITDFENASDALKQNFDARKSSPTDVENVLNRAYYIDGIMREYRFTGSAENQWRMLRGDLEKLRDYYSVKFDFNNRRYIPVSRFDEMLTGTYRLNAAQSDNVADIVAGAVNNSPANRRDRLQRNLERRLNSPEMLAIEKRNDSITLASTDMEQTSFQVDGVGRDETLPGGKTVKLTADSNYNGVSLNFEGDRINDFYISFMPWNNNQLRVIRRVYLENRDETVTVYSVYDKVNQNARWNAINRNNNAGTSEEYFVVPNNTPVTAVLDTPITTKASQDGDRFAMTVTGPAHYNGAVIEGHVAKAERSGRVSGRANLTLEFDTIRLTNGKTYRFAGYVEEVKMPNGEEISVNNEGTVKDDSQTKKTVTRTGIGAAIGAVIGAIAGGGKGAAIGALIGAGAGAGTVVLEGRDDVNLEKGTEFTLTATAPNQTARNR
ncbi:MAG: hypothetical protein R2747_03065 [Pyrinomonadaceae bacterium]